MKSQQDSQQDNHSPDVKLVWQTPSIEICNIDQTMATVGSSTDGLTSSA